MKTMDTMEIAVPIPEAAKILGDVLHAKVHEHPAHLPGVLAYTHSGDLAGDGLRVLVDIPALGPYGRRFLTLPLINPETGAVWYPPRVGAARGLVREGPDGFLGIYLNGADRPDALIGPPTALGLSPLVAAVAARTGKRGTVPAWVKRAGFLAEIAYESVYDEQKAHARAEKTKAKGWR